MKLHLQWKRPPVRLRRSRQSGVVDTIDLERVPTGPGIYIFGRRWGGRFEALYVGRAANIRQRVKSHLNSVKLMHHVRDAKNGRRVLLIGKLVTKPGQNRDKCLALAEKALIRHFLSEAHDLVNQQGTRIDYHELKSRGQPRQRFFPTTIHLAKGNGV